MHIGLRGFALTNCSNFKVKAVSLANGLRICFPPLLHFKIQLIHSPNKLILRCMVCRLEGYSKDDILSLVIIDITGQLICKNTSILWIILVVYDKCYTYYLVYELVIYVSVVCGFGRSAAYHRIHKQRSVANVLQRCFTKWYLLNNFLLIILLL